jgi:hypothetical protein
MERRRSRRKDIAIQTSLIQQCRNAFLQFVDALSHFIDASQDRMAHVGKSRLLQHVFQKENVTHMLQIEKEVRRGGRERATRIQEWMYHLGKQVVYEQVDISRTFSLFLTATNALRKVHMRRRLLQS